MICVRRHKQVNKTGNSCANSWWFTNPYRKALPSQRYENKLSVVKLTLSIASGSAGLLHISSLQRQLDVSGDRNCSCRRTMRSCPINISGKAERTESSLCSGVQMVLCLRESCCAQHHSPSFSPHFLFAPFLTLNRHAQHAAVRALGASHYVLYGQWVSQWEEQ